MLVCSAATERASEAGHLVPTGHVLLGTGALSVKGYMCPERGSLVLTPALYWRSESGNFKLACRSLGLPAQPSDPGKPSTEGQESGWVQQAGPHLTHFHPEAADGANLSREAVWTLPEAHRGSPVAPSLSTSKSLPLFSSQTSLTKASPWAEPPQANFRRLLPKSLTTAQ